MSTAQLVKRKEITERVGGKRSVSKVTVGYALAQLLRGINVVETNIGNIASRENGTEGLIVSGYSINYRGESCDLLSDVSISVDTSSKLGRAFGKSALELLREYVKISRCEDGLGLTSKLKGIQTNKLLVNIIKPGTDVNVVYKGREVRTRVDTSKWRHNSESKQLECIIITDKIPVASNKRLKVGLENYGIDLTSVDVEREFNKINRKVISMSNFGLIKPIAIRDELGVLIIDNQYAYFVGDGDDSVNIVGGWSLGKLAGLDRYKKKTNSLTFKKLEEYIRYIGKHKRYIVPYGLMDCNMVSSTDM